MIIPMVHMFFFAGMAMSLYQHGYAVNRLQIPHEARLLSTNASECRFGHNLCDDVALNLACA